MNQICFEHVSKTYPGSTQPAVNDVSLQIEPGRLVVLLGPSGCGKTTLLKMVNRLIEPTAGNISLNGRDIREIEAVKLRRQMGYVIQQVGLFPHMTVAENIAVVPRLLDWPKAKIWERTEALLDLVHLPAAEFAGRYPAQLSGGQAQRVGLARALAADPEVMLMDEPFGAIDAITRAGLQAEMLHLRETIKKTVLFVTHDVDEALRLADQIVVMRAGQVVQVGSPYQILTEPADEFVRDLVGAEDVLRQLSLLRVESVMLPPSEGFFEAGGALPALPEGSSLREALSLLLKRAAPRIYVVSGERVCGVIGLEQIREMFQQGGTRANLPG